MNKFKNHLLASVGFLVLVLTISLTGIGTSIAQGARECVRICNDEPLRVAVQNIARVQVASSSREPLHITQVLLVSDVFQKEVEITLVPGDDLGFTSFTVPAGKLLVIEDASGFVGFMGGGGPFFQVFFRTTANNNLAQHQLFANPSGGGFQIFTWGKATIYADPGSTVEIIFVRSHFDTNGTAKLNLTFSGHYINQ